MKKLSKAILIKSWLRWVFGNLSSMSYQWLESFGFADSMAPVIKELYGGNKEKEIEALKRHMAFYNTEPQIGSLINGITCGLEEKKANGADLDDEVINGIKLGLMGPLAGIGDAIVPGMYVPLLLSIGIGLSGNGSIMGPLFYIFTFIPSMLLVDYFLFMKGYHLGTKAIDFIVGEVSQRIREAFNFLGAIVVGGVAASYVSISTKLQIKTGNEDSIVQVSQILDNVFPKLIPLVIVLFCWWLMSKKNISALKVMGIMVILSIIGVLLGIF